MPLPAPDPSRPRPGVTVLSGFLGAGKTTVLQHLLAQNDGQRWAVIVNDLAALNVDAAIVRRSAGPDGSAVVELGNGCVCCSGRDDLGEALVRLASGGAYEHILVETTGVAEPREVAGLFTRANAFGRSVGDYARLSALVTVVDAADFVRRGAERDISLPASGGRRPVIELIIEQIECADVIVLNQTDRLEAVDDLARVELVMRGLNPRAEVVVTEHGQVGREFLLDRSRFDPGSTLAGAAWIQALNAVAPGASPASVGPRAARVTTAESRFGLRSFVWQARRPLRRGAWRSRMAQGWPGLVRAKGFFWEAEQPDEMGFVSVAGGAVVYQFLNYWWAAMIEAGRVAAEERPAAIRALWREPQGDRRQEIVFIGTGLDEAALRRDLEGCLAAPGGRGEHVE